MSPLNRREFVRRSGLYGAGLLIGLELPRPLAARAAAASSVPAVLSPAQWRALEAFCARILPTDEEPGATEAGCVNFIDKALANEDASAAPLYAGGLAALDGVAGARFDAPFATLEPKDQDAILESLEQGTATDWPLAELPAPLFFETARAHTIIAFLAEPRYGGNRDFAGWRVAGYPGPRHRRGGYSPAQVDGREPIRAIWESEPGKEPV